LVPSRTLFCHVPVLFDLDAICPSAKADKWSEVGERAEHLDRRELDQKGVPVHWRLQSRHLQPENQNCEANACICVRCEEASLTELIAMTSRRYRRSLDALRKVTFARPAGRRRSGTMGDLVITILCTSSRMLAMSPHEAEQSGTPGLVIKDQTFGINAVALPASSRSGQAGRRNTTGYFYWRLLGHWSNQFWSPFRLPG
jgi:hypothetical protein